MLPIALENPVAWVHLRLRGGWKTLMTSTVGYAGIILGVMFLSIRVDPGSATRTFYAWTQGLMGLQMGVLVLFAGLAIRGAVRKDFSTRMIESHRLMPISGGLAVVGYIGGASLQFLTLAAVNLLIGSFTASMTHVIITDWLLANLVLGIFVFCMWFAAVLSGFVGQGLFVLILLALGGLFFSNGGLVAVAPGLMVLAGPLVGPSVFGIIDHTGGWNWALQVSSLAQLGLAGFCFLGAVRKYRREDVLAFGPQTALVLLAGWLVLCAIGIQYYPEFRLQLFNQPRAEHGLQVIGSVLSAMLLGILPVASAAWMRTQWLARRARQDIALGRRPVAAELVAFSATAFIALFGLSMSNNMWPYLAMTTAGIALAFLLSVTYLLGILYRATPRTTFMLTLLVLVVWLLPLALDGVRYVMQSEFDPPSLTWISTLSPIGALIAATYDHTLQPLPGMAAQFLPAVVLGFFYYSTRGRWGAVPSRS